jgi:hypothetical protein
MILASIIYGALVGYAAAHNAIFWTTYIAITGVSHIVMMDAIRKAPPYPHKGDM